VPEYPLRAQGHLTLQTTVCGCGISKEDTGHLTQPVPQAVASTPQVIFLQALPGGYYGNSTNEMMPSSEPDEIEDPLAFPCVTDWLMVLQEGVLGHGCHSFMEYSPNFAKAHFIWISQIVDSLLADLLHICVGNPLGAAQIIHTQDSKET